MNYQADMTGKTRADTDAGRLRGLLSALHNCCAKRMVFESEKFGVPQTGLKALMLFEGKHSLTAQEIAEMLDVAKSRATVVLRDLEERELICRVTDPGDSRVRHISLTRQGKKIVKEIDTFVEMMHRKVLNGIAPAERVTVLKSLEAVRNSMETVKKEME